MKEICLRSYLLVQGGSRASGRFRNDSPGHAVLSGCGGRISQGPVLVKDVTDRGEEGHLRPAQWPVVGVQTVCSEGVPQRRRGVTRRSYRGWHTFACLGPKLAVFASSPHPSVSLLRQHARRSRGRLSEARVHVLTAFCQTHDLEQMICPPSLRILASEERFHFLEGFRED